MTTLQLDLDDQTIRKLKYALSKQVPDMTNGFTIQTKFGEIKIDSEFADHFRILAKVVLERQLNRLITY